MRSLLYALTVLSLPMRGAWIEMEIKGDADKIVYVAPHAGSVD